MAEQPEPGPPPFTQPNDRPQHLPRFTPEQLRVMIPQQEGKLRDLEHTPNQSAATISYQRDLVDGLKAQRDGGGTFPRPSPTAQRNAASAHRHTEDRFISHNVAPTDSRYPYDVQQFAEKVGVSVRTIDRGESSSGLLAEPPAAGLRPAARGDKMKRFYGDPEVAVAKRILGK